MKDTTEINYDAEIRNNLGKQSELRKTMITITENERRNLHDYEFRVAVDEAMPALRAELDQLKVEYGELCEKRDDELKVMGEANERRAKRRKRIYDVALVALIAFTIAYYFITAHI